MNSEAIKEKASAVVLVGGKSSRMGRSKALLPFEGEPLIVHLVKSLGRMFNDIVVVAAPVQEIPLLPVTVVRDEVAYQGPVAGIYYGLKAVRSEVAFVSSCDAPFLDLSLVAHLLSRIAAYDAVIPYWNHRWQPLLAVYRRHVLPRLREQIDRGQLRANLLSNKLRTCTVEEEEIRRFDPEGLSFFNVNTPEDYEFALERWRANRRRPETENDVPLGPSSADLTLGVTVELFGVARLRAKTSEIALELPQDATLAHVFLALAERLPTLVGSVIVAEKNGLTRGHACNINGRNFVRHPRAKVFPGDHIFIVSADAGG